MFPRGCVHCGGAVEKTGYRFLCAECASVLQFSRPPVCRTCGYPFFGIIAAPKSCPHCAELEPLFEEGRTLFLAKGPGRALLHELKYNAGFHVLHDLSRMLAGAPRFTGFLGNAVLVPVPLHPAKERERGYNQSHLIARTLAEAAEGCRVRALLQRVRPTQSQTRLDRSARLRNVKNAFALKPRALVIPGRLHILVDDVFTTGATLNACAETLRDAGIGPVRVVTVGHG